MIKLPTLKQIYTNLVNGFETGFGISILLLIGKNFLRTLAATVAAEFKLFYLTVGFLQKNFAPDTADSELEGGTLERFGRISLGRNPFPATAGQYQVIVTGTPGAVIKASTTFKSDDSSLNPGYLFILDEEFTLANATEYITLRALTAGVDAKLDLSNTLSATSPIILVNKTATVYTQVVEPRAAETIEAYRLAILNSYRLETQGGSAADYRLWAQDAQGVKQVYPFANSGYPSEVNIFVEATPTDSIDGKGTPSTALLNSVRDVIEFSPDITLTLEERGRRPANAITNVLPVSAKDVNLTIFDFQDLTADKQTAIFSELSDLINNIRPFVAAADVLENKNDILDVNRVISAIQMRLPGAQFSGVSMMIAGVPSTTKTLINGDITYLNTILYV